MKSGGGSVSRVWDSRFPFFPELHARCAAIGVGRTHKLRNLPSRFTTESGVTLKKSFFSTYYYTCRAASG